MVACSRLVVLNCQPDLVAIGFATSTEMAGQVHGLAPDLQKLGAHSKLEVVHRGRQIGLVEWM